MPQLFGLYIGKGEIIARNKHPKKRQDFFALENSLLK